MHQPPGLVLTSPPAAEPVTRAEAKLWGRIDTTADDAVVDSLITAARQYAEEYTCRAFVTQSWRMTIDGFPGQLQNRGPWIYSPGRAWPSYLTWPFLWDVVRLPKPPLASVDSIQYTDTSGVTQTLSPTLYQADKDAEPGRIRPAYGQVWPVVRWETLAAISITFTCGYGAAAAVPEGIKTAIKMHVAHRYANREGADIPDGINRQLDQFWTGSVQFSAAGAGR